MAGYQGRAGKKLIEFLTWKIQWGTTAEDLIARYQELELPKSEYQHLYEPKLLPGALHILQAFYELSSDRHVQWIIDGDKIRPFRSNIPFSSVVLWCGHNHVTGDTIALYQYCINKIDEAYCEQMQMQDNGGGTAQSGTPMSLNLFDRLFG